jgi:hypothetical protein
LRDLVRAREAVREDLTRARHRLSGLLLRHGIRVQDGTAWTQPHPDWLATITLRGRPRRRPCSMPSARSLLT